MAIKPVSKFTLEHLPRNDEELNELIQYHAQFTSKYHGIDFRICTDRFRDYVCESFLGMTNGGYQQLRQFWLKSTNDLDNADSLTEALLEKLPSTIYLNGSSDISTDHDAVKYLSRSGHISVKGDFFPLKKNHFDVICENYKVILLIVNYPNESKYGKPNTANKLGAACYAIEKGFETDEHFSVVSACNGSDDCGDTYLVLVRK
ncbi:hypothetical protein [Photobacterium kishitanii]|uniref:Uncharacterized protein n=1 Tax=Photobacterium kishitanii TaxID=318456 RepID=A0A2T3KLC1_9GAMM|nr:hypothetical protein [Photobacterium kishitanii]PSV00450.1 hypothetical protein C9J27_04780 [Photobacterium kishitanii]